MYIKNLNCIHSIVFSRNNQFHINPFKNLHLLDMEMVGLLVAFLHCLSMFFQHSLVLCWCMNTMWLVTNKRLGCKALCMWFMHLLEISHWFREQSVVCFSICCLLHCYSPWELSLEYLLIWQWETFPKKNFMAEIAGKSMQKVSCQTEDKYQDLGSLYSYRLIDLSSLLSAF